MPNTFIAAWVKLYTRNCSERCERLFQWHQPLGHHCYNVTLHPKLNEYNYLVSHTFRVRTLMWYNMINHHLWESWSSSWQKETSFYMDSHIPSHGTRRQSLSRAVCQHSYSAWPGRQEARKLLDPWFLKQPMAGLISGDLGALEAKSEPPSQHCATDTEVWTWKLNFLVTFQTCWLDSEQAARRQWTQPAGHQKCTDNISVKHFGVYEYIFSNKTLLHCKSLTTLNS